MKKSAWRSLGLLCVAVFALGGCAYNATPSQPHDPWESGNRKVYNFNDTLDRWVVEPVSDAYVFVTPRFFRAGLDNFYENITYPKVILNSFLQGKGGQGARDTGRFLVNSTLGVAGLFDVAHYMGMPANDEDFGQTFAVWGANSGPYLVLPGAGPSTVRHTAGLPLSLAANPLTYVVSWTVSVPLFTLYYLNKRAELGDAVRLRDEAALDPYVFTRSSYLQHRYNLIHDGSPPESELSDELFDEAFE